MKLYLKDGIEHTELLKYGFTRRYDHLYDAFIGFGYLNYIQYDIEKGYFEQSVSTTDFMGYNINKNGKEIYEILVGNISFYKDKEVSNDIIKILKLG